MVAKRRTWSYRLCLRLEPGARTMLHPDRVFHQRAADAYGGLQNSRMGRYFPTFLMIRPMKHTGFRNTLRRCQRSLQSTHLVCSYTPPYLSQFRIPMGELLIFAPGFDSGMNKAFYSYLFNRRTAVLTPIVLPPVLAAILTSHITPTSRNASII